MKLKVKKIGGATGWRITIPEATAEEGTVLKQNLVDIRKF